MLEVLVAVVAIVISAFAYIAARNANKGAGQQQGLNFDENSIPTASEGESIPVLFGTRQIKASNVVAHGNYHWREMSWGGKKNKKKAVRYYLSWHSILAVGRLDCIRNIMFDEVVIWGAGYKANVKVNDGNRPSDKYAAFNIDNEPQPLTPQQQQGVPITFGVSSNEFIIIDEEDILGGREKEGGYSGGVQISFGDHNYTPPSWKTVYGNKDVPLYRGTTNLFFNDFYFGLSPYLKPMSVIASRILYDWKGEKAQWYPEKAVINDLDMNPAHIIREIIISRSPDYGLAFADNAIDEQSFREAADILYNEKFGLSLLWTGDDDAMDMIKQLENHIAGKVFPDRKSRKIKLKLYRDNYNFNSLRVLNYDTVKQLVSYKEATAEDLINHVAITYWDRERLKKGTVVQSNAALYDITGVTNAQPTNYPFICTQELAARVASRDLKMVSMPLAKLEIECNRLAFDVELGDIIRVNMEDDKIPDVAYRVMNLTYDAEMNYVKIQLLQDVFGFPKGLVHRFDGNFNSYQKDRSSKDAVGVLGEEASKMDLFKTELLKTLKPNTTLAVVTADNASSEIGWYFSMKVGRDLMTYNEMLQFSDISYLRDAVTPNETKIKLINPVYNVERGSIITIDKERMLVSSYDLPNGEMTVVRGIEDTHTDYHKVNAIIHLQSAPYYAPQMAIGETLYYRTPTTNGSTRQSPFNVTERSVALKGRYKMPYPPQAIKINNEYNPVEISAFAEPDKRTYFTLSARARSNKIEDWSVTWFSDVNNPDPNVKYYYSVGTTIGKTEFPADGSKVKIYMAQKDMHRSKVKVWAETLDGIASYNTYEYVLKLTEFKNNLFTFDYNNFEFTNTGSNYLNLYRDRSFQAADGSWDFRAYFMFDIGIANFTPYIRMEHDGSAMEKLYATFKVGTYDGRKGRVNVQLIAYHNNSVVDMVETGLMGNFPDAKWREKRLELTNLANVDYVDVKLIIEKDGLVRNAFGIADLIVEKE